MRYYTLLIAGAIVAVIIVVFAVVMSWGNYDD